MTFEKNIAPESEVIEDPFVKAAGTWPERFRYLRRHYVSDWNVVEFPTRRQKDATIIGDLPSTEALNGDTARVQSTEPEVSSETVPSDVEEACVSRLSPATDEPAKVDEPTSVNDAEFWGEDSPEFDALLAQEATLLNGEMWGARDRRNTQDGEWTQTKMLWAHWILGQAATKNTPAWGFSRHPVGKHKEGVCIVLGSSIGKARKAKAMENMFAIGLDIDSGASLDKVLAKVESLGLCALAYTSFNHGKRGLHLKRDDVLRKLGIKGDPSIEEVRQYLRDFDKNRYEENFIAQVEIVDPKKQVKEGVVIELSTPPLEKFRLIFPLAEAVKIVDLAERHDDALAIWEDTVTGLAVNLLGVHFDTSCTDPSRLFYTARHAADADDYYAAIVRGRALTFAEIEPYKKSLYTSKRGKLNPFEAASGIADAGDKPPMAYTPSGKSLNEWHSRAKERFLLAEVLETYCPDRVRIAGGEAQGHVHVECPFEAEHSKEGGFATMAVNALDSQRGYWTWFCHHDACQGRHKLQFLEEALRQGWFPEEVLFDDEFILPAEDGADEDDSEVIETPDGGKVSASTLQKRFRKMIRDEASKADRADAIRDAVSESGFNKTEVTTLWKEAAAGVAQAEREAEAEKRKNARRPDYVPLPDATPMTVEQAAENAQWLPTFARYRNGWFEAQSNDPESGWRRMCRAFEVPFFAFGETANGRSTDVTIRYQHRSAEGGIVESVYSIGDTFKESGTFLGRLADEGLELDAMADTAALIRLFRSVNTSNEAVLINKAGWHGDVYIAPTGAIVNAGGKRFILNPKLRVSTRTQGTLAQHHAFATTALTGINGRYLLPGYLAGLVGCVVDYIGNEVSLVLAHEGASTRGKSSAAKAGTAHWSIPTAEGLLQPADTTANAAENNAVRANGSVLALDEEGAAKITAEEKQRLILQWADGSGRSRATADGANRATLTWRTCIVTSAEVGFVNRMAAEDADVKTGAVARVFSVNYDAAAILDPASEELAAIRALANYEDSGVYGVSGPVFAEKLAQLGRDAVKARVSEVEAEWSNLSKGAGTRVVRAAAIFAVAGEIAQEAGIFGMQVPVREMMRGLLADTLSARTGHLDTDRQVVDNIRRAVIRGIQTGSIVSVHDDREFNRQEIFGYFGHFAPNGRPDKELTQKMRALGSEAEMRARTYVLPLDRLGKGLGILDDAKSVADRLAKIEALIKRKKGQQDQWWHDHVPSEGSGNKNIRVRGDFIHGIDEDGDGKDGAC
ncbi:DUF927 domain-containing protein [Pararhodobacter sp.]|uniref:DUF927 domain-containing protein n=1 Tax=Pararhodobacter sp. TaxID=2127056 RepID=UPI002FDDCAA2